MRVVKWAVMDDPRHRPGTSNPNIVEFSEGNKRGRSKCGRDRRSLWRLTRRIVVEKPYIGSGTNWSHASTLKGTSGEGWDNLDIFAKLPSYCSLEHDFFISFALHFQLPTGDQAGEEQNLTSLGPTHLLDRSMGGLPN